MSKKSIFLIYLLCIPIIIFVVNVFYPPAVVLRNSCLTWGYLDILSVQMRWTEKNVQYMKSGKLLLLLCEQDSRVLAHTCWAVPLVFSVGFLKFNFSRLSFMSSPMRSQTFYGMEFLMAHLAFSCEFFRCHRAVTDTVCHAWGCSGGFQMTPKMFFEGGKLLKKRRSFTIWTSQRTIHQVFAGHKAK